MASARTFGSSSMSRAMRAVTTLASSAQTVLFLACVPISAVLAMSADASAMPRHAVARTQSEGCSKSCARTGMEFRPLCAMHQTSRACLSMSATEIASGARNGGVPELAERLTSHVYVAKFVRREQSLPSTGPGNGQDRWGGSCYKPRRVALQGSSKRASWNRQAPTLEPWLRV